METAGELACAWSVAAADMSARRQASSVDSGGEKSGADGLPDIRGHGSATASESKRGGILWSLSFLRRGCKLYNGFCRIGNQINAEKPT